VTTGEEEDEEVEEERRDEIKRNEVGSTITHMLYRHKVCILHYMNYIAYYLHNPLRAY